MYDSKKTPNPKKIQSHAFEIFLVMFKIEYTVYIQKSNSMITIPQKNIVMHAAILIGI